MSTYEFFIASIVIILVPGTGVIYTVSTGITAGKRCSFYAAAGCTLGILPHLFISIMLSSFLLNMNETVFSAVKFMGAAYLLWMGFGMLRRQSDIKVETEVNRKRPMQIIGNGILINLLNPKLTLFFFSFLPQYVSTSEGGYVLKSWLYGLMFMLLTWVVFIGYGLIAGVFQRKLSDSGKARIMQKLFGVIFIICAVRLAFAAA